VLECLLQELLRRGHEIHVVLDLDKRVEGTDAETLFDGLARMSSGRFSYALSGQARDPRGEIATGLRRTLDYLRYLEPRYADSVGLRERAARRIPRFCRLLAPLYGDGSSVPSAAVRRSIAGVERALPTSRAAAAVIAEHAPDIVAVSPLVELGSPQTEYVRAARDAGIPCVLVVASWDNLTNKGLIHERPDRLVVWNVAQRDEASDLHGIPASSVEVVGAHTFDHWFTWQPSRTRAEFCAMLGFEPDRPLLLYLGSSAFIAGDERSFVAEWVEQLRASGHKQLQRAGVIVRPHPQNGAMWAADPFPAEAGIVVWPLTGAAPTDTGKKRDFFDSLHFAGAAMGINTSAMIEAGVTRTPAYTIVDERFHDGQSGTLHFAYLTGTNGRGLLHSADSWSEHLAQLADAFDHPDAAVAGVDDFLRWFVRPCGLDIPAAPLAATAIESTLPQGPRAKAGGVAGAVAAILVMAQRARLAARVYTPRVRRSARRNIRHLLDTRHRASYATTLGRIPSRVELPEMLNRRGLVGVGVEVGVKKGGYSRLVLDTWRGSKLISVDPWLAESADAYRDRANVTQDEHELYYERASRDLAAFGARSEIWRMTSLEAAALVPDDSLDFVFIDARHDYVSVLEDLGAWFPKLRAGAIIAGHDYVDGMLEEGEFGVKRAVDEFFAAQGITVFSTSGSTVLEVFPSWLAEVPERVDGRPGAGGARSAARPDRDRRAVG